MATSRCFALRRSETHVMAPLIDMANHSSDSNCEMRSSEDGCVSLVAKTDVGTGVCARTCGCVLWLLLCLCDVCVMCV